jgi:S-formylglutathione hydrolase FrmB
MGRAECRTVPSKILQRTVRYCVLLPGSYDTNPARKYPVFYYLHGLGDNEQSLVRSGGWEFVEQLQEQGKIGKFLIVTPDGGRSFYVNSRDGKEKYEDFFLQEFIPAIEKRYRVLGTRAGRGIGGTSMGGYGALRFAFKYPQLFAAVSAHSAVLVEQMQAGLSASFGRSFRAFGEPFDSEYWRRNTPFSLLTTGKSLGGL